MRERDGEGKVRFHEQRMPSLSDHGQRYRRHGCGGRVADGKKGSPSPGRAGDDSNIKGTNFSGNDVGACYPCKRIPGLLFAGCRGGWGEAGGRAGSAYSDRTPKLRLANSLGAPMGFWLTRERHVISGWIWEAQLPGDWFNDELTNSHPRAWS